MPEPYTGPKFRNFQHLCELYFMEACIGDGAGPTPPTRECTVPLEAYEQLEKSFLHVYRLLKWEDKKGKKEGTIPITHPGWMGTYYPALDRSRANAKRLSEQDGGLLMDMIVTLGPYTTLANTPNDDELLKGVAEYLHGEDPPLWFVFAGQMFLDIHSVLKTKGEQPYKDLYDYAPDARRTLRGYDKFFERMARPHRRLSSQTDGSKRCMKRSKAGQSMTRSCRSLMTECRFVSKCNKTRDPGPRRYERGRRTRSSKYTLSCVACGGTASSFRCRLRVYGLSMRQ